MAGASKERLVHCNADKPHVDLLTSQNAPDATVDGFKAQFQIVIQQLNEEVMEFDMIGVDASLANAYRRILLSEVPTMAIETIYIWNNTSIIQDEVLSHRLGLIPLNVDPREFECFPENEEAEATDQNTIIFKIDVECRTNALFPNDPSKAHHACVYSRDLEWVPQGSQAEKFPHLIRPVSEDILIAKLRPGQSIALEAHCRKGVGKDHAKFSPVCTAAYRLMPKITFKEPVLNEEAQELKAKCPMNVFDIEDLGNGRSQAVVKTPRACTMCRECIRQPEWADKIQLSRKFDHFLFSVESVGMLHPKDIMLEALGVFEEKINRTQDAVPELCQS